MESVVVSILRGILDRLMKAPGETPEGALTRRGDSTRPARLLADPAGKPVPAGRDG